jgi:hypothetical protein
MKKLVFLACIVLTLNSLSAAENTEKPMQDLLNLSTKLAANGVDGLVD